ncbi:hypothetical protein BC835DRAFT_1419005 [Cytidiella melzeri]|nr:hypothetical protein BC835DRAFT_1419005 [Cytidiella melzeri]
MAMNSPSPSSKNYQATKIHDTQTKSRVKSGSKSAAHSVNYAEQSHGKKKSNQTKKQLTKATSKTLVHPASDVDVNAVPNPAPDTGGSHTLYPSGAIYTGVLPVIMPTSTQQPLSTSGFSPLPPLSAFATSLAVTTVATSSASKSAAASSATVLGSQQQAHPSAPKHLSTVIIVLLGVGSAFLLLGCYVLYRMFKRPRKHHYPTPSLPILQDDYMEERKIDAEEESLFGGKERISAKPGSDGTPLTWTQYPHVSLAKPPPSFNVDDGPPNRKSSDFGQKPTYPFSGPNASATNTAARTMNRISAVSASVYPGSPMSGNVCLALTGSPLTADGMPVLQRCNSKPTARRMSTSRDIRQSVIVSNKLHVPSTYGTSDLYGGPASPLPPNPTTPKATAMSSAKPGRARVKAPYAPASLLRSSANAPHTHDRNPFEESQYVLPPLSPMVKSEDHRERDTKALASALGLASPTPASPQTIYPDDSITLAGDRRRSRSQFIMSPTLDASARLGKLMLGDTQSMVSIADAGSAPQANSSSRARAVARKRVEEKPPRVPSPPPLPSLAQMALAHSNPQDFEDYRSPTYSIYGLYEADRKSRNPDGGGY